MGVVVRGPNPVRDVRRDIIGTRASVDVCPIGAEWKEARVINMEIFDWFPECHFGRPEGPNWLYVDIYPEWRTYGRTRPVLEWAPVYYTEAF